MPSEHTVYPAATAETSPRRRALAPEVNDAFENFNGAVFREGALCGKAKQLAAAAVAHVTQCPYCISGHSKAARCKGASDEEIMEAIWVAAGVRAGGAYARSTVALHALADEELDMVVGDQHNYHTLGRRDGALAGPGPGPVRTYGGQQTVVGAAQVGS